MKEHEYSAHLTWDGNRGDGTASYEAYGRDFRIVIPRKPELAGSANGMFRGDPAKHDPEDLFLSAIAACHMLAYLSLCARSGIRVVAYEDRPTGRLVLDGSGGRFEQVVLRPTVTIAGEGAERAWAFHDQINRRCFIARSCSVPIRHEATVLTEEYA